ncbi:hypothetical protein RJ640_008243 [Escallonia rubra]|uniref:GAG-pre-integrase domain-containing protein n=1 Tax=Escallonia rubra TaxID=112253 RepID=A0AA88Q8A9_9ASTE|nr:hypothetical protein RJ640_008243 [Escallonia rubra]
MYADEKEDMLERAHNALVLCLANNVLRKVSHETIAAGLWLKLESLYMTKSLTNRIVASSTVTGAAAVASSSDIDFDTTMLWHMHLGHMSERGMDVLSKQGLLGSKKTGKLDFCEHCVFRKQCRVNSIGLFIPPKENWEVRRLVDSGSGTWDVAKLSWAKWRLWKKEGARGECKHASEEEVCKRLVSLLFNHSYNGHAQPAAFSSALTDRAAFSSQFSSWINRTFDFDSDAFFFRHRTSDQRPAVAFGGSEWATPYLPVSYSGGTYCLIDPFGFGNKLLEVIADPL